MEKSMKLERKLQRHNDKKKRSQHKKALQQKGVREVVVAGKFINQEKIQKPYIRGDADE